MQNGSDDSGRELEEADSYLAQIRTITRLFEGHAIDERWDARDHVVASVLLRELREVTTRYRAIVARAEQQVDAAAASLRSFQRELEAQ